MLTPEGRSMTLVREKKIGPLRTERQGAEQSSPIIIIIIILKRLP